MKDVSELKKYLRLVGTRLFKKANFEIAGIIKSHFKGSGIQFKEHQLYHPGDDTRFIDWKLSAKSNKIYVKTYEEERNVKINVILDISSEMYLRTNNGFKMDCALDALFLLILMCEKTRDTIVLKIWNEKDLEMNLLPGLRGIHQVLGVLKKEKILTNSLEVKNAVLERKRTILNKKRKQFLKHQLSRGIPVVVFCGLGLAEKLRTELPANKLLEVFQITHPLESGKEPMRPMKVFGKSGLVSNIEQKPETQKGFINWEIDKDDYLDNFITTIGQGRR